MAKAQVAIGLNTRLFDESNNGPINRMSIYREFKARNLRGQVAIEYLMTYGWAILVLLIIIGLILGSGIASPIISEDCNLGSKITCRHFLYNDGANLKLLINMTNGFEHKIKIKTITVTLVGKGNMATVLTNDDPESGESSSIEATFAGYNAPRDSSKTIQVLINYYSCAPEVNPSCVDIATHPISGKISAKAN
ncbi:hypothetical protein J4450_01195 [Candidatus Micrarchaeota archaeon]|nr:hypothetical protein [Candidatus Micrarchaeota archaeon]